MSLSDCVEWDAFISRFSWKVVVKNAEVFFWKYTLSWTNIWENMTLISSVEMVRVAPVASRNVNGLDFQGKIREGPPPTLISYGELKPADTDWYPANKFWSAFVGLMASRSVWISVPLCEQVGIAVPLKTRFVWPLLVSEWALALWNKTLLYSTPTFTYFPIKQLSGSPHWPRREYCKPSIVSSYRLSQGGSNESLGPLRASTCTLRPLLSPSSEFVLK